jgi:hypothetical protein
MIEFPNVFSFLTPFLIVPINDSVQLLPLPPQKLPQGCEEIATPVKKLPLGCEKIATPFPAPWLRGLDVSCPSKKTGAGLL